jgi:hypothetical protein
MDTLNSVLFLLFCGITSVALLIVLNLLLSGTVKGIQEKLEGHYIRSFLIGLITLGLSFAILLLLGYLINLPIFQTMARENVSYLNAIHGLVRVLLTMLLILLGLSLISISSIGLAALVNLLNRRIGNSKSSINPNLPGAALVVLAGLAPFLGWFIFTPVALCIGFGSTVQAFFQRKATPKALE